MTLFLCVVLNWTYHCMSPCLGTLLSTIFKLVPSLLQSRIIISHCYLAFSSLYHIILLYHSSVCLSPLLQTRCLPVLHCVFVSSLVMCSVVLVVWQSIRSKFYVTAHVIVSARGALLSFYIPHSHLPFLPLNERILCQVGGSSLTL